MAFTIKHLTSLVQIAVEHNASDIHIRMDEAPCLRIRGELKSVNAKPLGQSELNDICSIVFNNQELTSKINHLQELDGSFEIPETCRLRYNYFKYNDKIGLILRIIKTSVPTIEELKLPQVINQICHQKRGLILVTGATGSGKSTTMASMINEINQNSSSHIITIEDPIEYIHQQKKSRITQREIGKDTENFTSGLRSALRQDPDVLLIGELRDSETISTALKAAETGHLVLATVHTSNTISTITRIIAMFPHDEQQEIKKRLAENLYATIGQRMLRGVVKNSIVLAQEIMITGPGIKECIIGKEDMSRIRNILSNSKNKDEVHGQSFDQHIMELYKDGRISKETALSSVDTQADFLQKLVIE